MSDDSGAYDKLAELCGLKNPRGHVLIAAAVAEIERLRAHIKTAYDALMDDDMGLNDRICAAADVLDIARAALEGKV